MVTNGTSGLIEQYNNCLIYTDLSAYTGVFMINQLGEADKISDCIPWYMNIFGNNLYYSDAVKGHGLYELDLCTGIKRLLIKEPSCNIQVKNKSIYYINETNNSLCCVDFEGKSNVVLVDKDVKGFTLNESEMYYITSDAIRKRHIEDIEILSVRASGLIQSGVYLYFSDVNNGYNLCQYNCETDELHKFHGVASMDLCMSDDYVYCSNLYDNKSIYRIGNSDKSCIRMSSESAFGLQFIDQSILFYNLNDGSNVYQMPSSGGRSTKLSRDMGAKHVGK